MKNKKRGFTLVELIVAMSILAVVAGAVYSVYMFSLRSYSKGAEQSGIQYDVRRAGAFITSETRNSRKLELIDLSEVKENDSEYSYIYVDNSRLYCRRPGKSPVEMTGEIFSEAFQSFTIIKLENGSNLLAFSLEAEKFKIESQVALNNIKGMEETRGEAIKYKK